MQRPLTLLPSVSQRLADFAIRAGTDFPAPARERAVDAITDCIGCLLAGASEPVASVVRAVVPTVDNGARLIGSDAHASPADSALLHGTLAHALDFDDTNHPAYAHPGAVLVPVMLALAAQEKLRGADFVTAYIVGFQIFGRLGRALNFDHYQRGWHATSTFGTLAAAAVAARLLRLDRDRTTVAIGIAASEASGVRANFGSMVKPLHAGLAARNGVLAALLAQAGMNASVDALDHAHGFINVFNDGAQANLEALSDWHVPLEILGENALALKAYPACGATHPAIEAAIALRADIAGKDIDSITVHATKRAFAPLRHVVPHTPLEAKFSMQFCVAAALHDGEVNLATFSQPSVDDPSIRHLMGMVTMVSDPSLSNESEFPARVEVRTVDGAVYARSVALALGKPSRWFSKAQLRSKFMDCARRTLNPGAAAAAFTALQGIDRDVAADSVLDSLFAPTAAAQRHTA